MSRFEELKVQNISKEQAAPEHRWIDRGDDLEVIWIDDTDEGHLTTGVFQGLRIDPDGGPTYFVLESDGDELVLHTEEVLGATVVAVQG
jgi:hypothetical protein